jgi:outer membrane receptor protein involved in Fe transport
MRRRIALLAFLFGYVAIAQVTTATFFGAVTDPSGAVVAAAEVTLVHEATSASLKQTTNVSGEFAFDFLQVGAYRLSIQMPGFKRYEASGIDLGAAQRVRRNFTLEIGSAAETVTVSGQAPAINAASPEQRESISRKEVTELPVARRNISNVMALGTGIVQDTASRRNSFILNGLGKAATSVTMDGIPASGTSEISSASVEGGYIGVVSMEAVEEVQVSKGVFAAEYGRALAGNVNVITKSGTNQLHGSLFELFSAEELNARNQLLATKRGLTFNQFGGSLGGPLIRDKVFVFGAYEAYRQRSFQPVQAEVPTALLRGQMLAAVPDYKIILDGYPLPNQPFAANALSGRYLGAASAAADTNHLVVRPDLWLSSRMRLSATYVRDNPGEIVPSPLLFGPQTFDGNLDRVTVTLSTFGPRWSSESRVGWNRADRTRIDGIYEKQDPSKKESSFGGRRIPGIAVSNLGISGAGEINSLANAPSWSADEKVSYNLGRHSFKFGALFFREKAGRANVEVPLLTYANPADLLANIPSSARFTFGVAPYQASANNIGFFAQDDWRLNRRLTLNLGLRYDYFSAIKTTGVGSSGPPHVYNPPLLFPNFALGPHTFQATGPAAPDKINFGPRFGFAWDLTGAGRTVVRGGVGVMFNSVNPSIFALGTIIDPKFPYRSTFTRAENIALGIRYPSYNEDVLAKVASGSALPSYQLVDRKIKASYAINYTFGLQHAFTESLVLESALVANRGVKFFFDRRFNEGDRFTGIRPNRTIADNLYFDNSESTNYFSWQSSLRKRYSRNIVGNVHYTWGKIMSYGTGDLAPLANRSFIQDFFNIRANKGRAHQDITHSFVSDLVYELPRLNRSVSLIRHLLGGWQTTGILRARTGFPITLNQPSSRDRSRPDVIDFDNAVLDRGSQYLNPAAFRRVPVVAATGMPERAGNVGRNVWSGPGSWTVDFAVGKRFTFAEKFNLDLRADFFNGFNHTNRSGLNVNINSAVFGVLTGTDGAREAQLNLRFSF